MSRTTTFDDGVFWAWVGVATLCGCAALAGLLALFLVPLYAGSVLVPVAVLIALVTNVALPRLARTLIDTTAASVLPFVCWLIVVVGIGVVTRPEGDVVLPGGGGGQQWVAYGVLLGGALAGALTVALSSGQRPAGLERVSR
jgi:hypothetical protein